VNYHLFGVRMIFKNRCYFGLSLSKQKKQTSSLVVQHNYLIEANYDLTLQEKRIIVWLASQVKPDDVDFKDHVIKISEFCKIAGLKSKNMHKEIEKITLSLIERSLQIYSPLENKLLQVTWLNSAEYLYNDGSVKLCFSPKLKPYLLELKNCFTRLSLENMMLFKSVYAIRLYELLKQYQKLGVREIRIDDLRKNLGIQQDEYRLYGHFKKKVIEIAKREINEKSDVQVDFLEIKGGRKVDSIQFSIKTQKNSAVETQIPMKTGHAGIHISDHSLDQLRKEFSDDAVNQGLLSLQSYKGTVKNPVLFLKKAIKGGWQPFQDTKPQEPSKEVAAEIQLEISALDEDPVCLQIRKFFLERNGAAEYRSWIQPLSLQLADDCVVIVAKSVFIKDWLETNCAKNFTDYADGRKIIFLTEEKDGNSQLGTETKNKFSVSKKMAGKKSLMKSKPGSVNENKDLTVMETTQEQPVPAVKKKSLWGRITGLWK
jgi:plasmid replication initiation protein